MSVIVYAAGVLVVDRRIVDGGMREEGVKSWLVDGPHGKAVVAAVGALHSALRLRQWYVDGADVMAYPPGCSEGKGEATLVVMLANGSVTEYDSHGCGLPIERAGWYAWGSGRNYAMGAMHVAEGNGVDPEQFAVVGAVAACRYDVFCGEGLDIYRTDGSPMSTKYTIYQRRVLFHEEARCPTLFWEVPIRDHDGAETEKDAGQAGRSQGFRRDR